jgi:hypothetical protein
MIMTTGAKSATVNISPNTKNFSSVRMPTQGIDNVPLEIFDAGNTKLIKNKQHKFWEELSQSQSHIATDGRSVSQSVSLGVEPQ